MRGSWVVFRGGVEGFWRFGERSWKCSAVVRLRSCSGEDGIRVGRTQRGGVELLSSERVLIRSEVLGHPKERPGLERSVGVWAECMWEFCFIWVAMVWKGLAIDGTRLER